jgi:hypothetical protein
MTTRALTTLAAALLTAAAFPAATPASTAAHAISAGAPAAAPDVRLIAFGGRGPAGVRLSGKLDGALEDLARHVNRVRAGYEMEDLRSLSPAARFQQTLPGEPPRVLIDAVTRGDAQQLKAALESLGLTGASVYANDVGGWLPVTQIGAAAARAEVHSVRAALPHSRAGAVTSQGDFAQRSDVLRTSNSLDGTGITVGVLSDSYNCYSTYAANHVAASGLTGYAFNGFTADAQTDMSTGDLPASVNVLKDVDCMSYSQYSPAILPFTDEGRAMLQVVHDVAPGASLAFYTADNSEADFANGIQTLANAGARVIADDVGYYNEPFFQDGLVAEAINAVAARGVAYFSAAGNDGTKSFETTQPSFLPVEIPAGGCGSGPCEQPLNFAPAGASVDAALPITIPQLFPGEYLALIVEWDQPYVTGAPGSPGASSQIDLCVAGSGSDVIFDLDGKMGACTGPNALGTDPVQVLIIGNPATSSGYSAAESLTVGIGLASGPVPGRIKFVLAANGAGATINKYSTNSSTLQGHPGAAGAAAVAAAFYFDTPRCGAAMAQLEDYSSRGGAPILFDSTGARLASPQVRNKPDFVAPDGVANTFLGFQLTSSTSRKPPSTTIAACQDPLSPGSLGVYPSFFGTSAATPHAAGIAALMLQAQTSATPAQIRQALSSTALPMGGTGSGYDYDTGAGFIQADAAFAALSSSSSSSSSSAPSGHGGGGSLEVITLLGLGALVTGRLLRRRHGRGPDASQ